MKKSIVLVMFSMILSAGATYFVSHNVFITNTPLLRPNIAALNPFSKYKPLVQEKNPRLSPQIVDKIISNLPLTPVAKGVYAAQDRDNGITYYKLMPGLESEEKYFVTPDGVRHLIHVPKKLSTGN